MKLRDLWKEKDVTLSFEAFPPKKDSDFDSVRFAVEQIAELKPDFMSVTYGAGGAPRPIRQRSPASSRRATGCPPWPT